MPQPTIIIVDDDQAIRQSLKFSLELEGFAVETYSDAEAFAEDGPGPAGCLVIDYNLPGIDGLQLLERLRGAGLTVPAIIITSNPTSGLRSRIGAAPAVLVEKPLLCDALAAEVRRALAA